MRAFLPKSGENSPLYTLSPIHLISHTPSLPYSLSPALLLGMNPAADCVLTPTRRSGRFAPPVFAPPVFDRIDPISGARHPDAVIGIQYQNKSTSEQDQ